MTDPNQKILQAASCLVCILVAFRYSMALEGSEFSGGRITGPLLDLFDSGILLFLFALLLTFFFRRIAAVIALMASSLCLPLYVYFTTPGPFRFVFRGEYSVPLQTNFVWDTLNVTAMATITIGVIVCIRGFFVHRQPAATSRSRSM